MRPFLQIISDSEGLHRQDSAEKIFVKLQTSNPVDSIAGHVERGSTHMYILNGCLDIRLGAELQPPTQIRFFHVCFLPEH